MQAHAWRCSPRPGTKTSSRFHFNSGVSSHSTLDWHGGVTFPDVSSEGLIAVRIVCRPDTLHLDKTNTRSSTSYQRLLQNSSKVHPALWELDSFRSHTRILAATTRKHTTVRPSSRPSYVFISQWAHPDTRVCDWNSVTWGLHLVSCGQRHSQGLKGGKTAHMHAHAHTRATARQQLRSDCLIDDVKVLPRRSRNSILSNCIKTCAKGRHVRCFQTPVRVGGGLADAPRAEIT